MLKRALLASTAVLSLGSAAFAADLPARRAPPVPFVAVPVFTWTGFYIGANAGYVFSDENRVRTTGNDVVTVGNVAVGARPQELRLNPEGFSAGGQIGYNYQIGTFVVGLEADAAYTDLLQTRTVRGTVLAPPAPGIASPLGGALSTFRTDTSFIGTVRGRLGVAFDRTLVYATGGLAYGDRDEQAIFFNRQFANAGAGDTTVVFAGRRTGIDTGYAVGGGVEFAMPTSFSFFGSNAVTLKAEALYYDLGRRNVVVASTPAGPAGQSYTARFENSGVIARAGINFKFGSF
jgi:outer membrane immunogenic protein